MDETMINEQIERTLGSLDGLQRAYANPFLYQKIQQRLERVRSQDRFKPALVWRLAAVCLLLLGLNVLSWVQFNKVETASTKSSIQRLYSEYISYNSTYDY